MNVIDAICSVCKDPSCDLYLWVFIFSQAWWEHRQQWQAARFSSCLAWSPRHPRMSFEYAYRILGKRFHPDKNKESDATEVLKKINIAYQARRNSSDSSVPRYEGECNHTDSDHAALSHISIITRENSFCGTIDFTDIVSLAKKHYCVNLFDRGHNGLQFRFECTNPDDATEHYGMLSLTFYVFTSRLLVQGTSFLLWIDKHLPIIYTKAEQVYDKDICKWRS